MDEKGKARKKKKENEKKGKRGRGGGGLLGEERQERSQEILWGDREWQVSILDIIEPNGRAVRLLSASLFHRAIFIFLIFGFWNFGFGSIFYPFSVY